MAEKTLDLYGTYNENDLIIESVPFASFNGEMAEIPQIKGLKNKEIENKINKDIKNKMKKEIDAFEEKYSEVGYFNSTDYANFSNIISLRAHLYECRNTKESNGCI